jgi:hypothetical protein
VSERFEARLFNAQSGYQELLKAWAWAKPMLLADNRLTLEIKREKRSDAENRLLHLLLSHISKTQEWAGKKRSIDVWKRLLTAAWLRARGESIEILPALDGHGIDVVFRATSRLTVSECAELIEYIYSWCAMNGVELPADPRHQMACE